MTGLAGTGGLVRLILRRDRVILPVWLGAIAVTVLQWVATAGTVYPTQASRQARFDEVAATPMFLLFQGQLFGTSLGAVLVQRAAPVAAMLAALGAALMTARHTRAEEQTGRRELLGATGVGRHAPLTAVLAVMFGCGVLITAVLAAVLSAAGFPPAGSLCFGLVIGCSLWLTAASTAVLAQLAQHARVAAIGGFALFYALHLLRGIGAMGGDAAAWLVWLTPTGWLENTRPFAGERWWIFALVTAAILLAGAGAYALSARRDLGAGLVPPRAGHGHAPASLRGPLGLVWRLGRAMLITWVVGAAAFGVIMGAVGSGAMGAYAGSPWVIDFARMINTDDVADALFTYIIGAMAIVVGMYGVMTTLRLRGEEAGGAAETILSGPVSRHRFVAAHLGFAAVAPVLILAALGAGLGLGSGLSGGDLAGELVRLLGHTLRYAPAIWVIIGVTAVAFGLVPRAATVIGWAGLAIGVTAEVAVKAYVLPEWVFRAVSPFSHVSPAYGSGAVDYLALTALAAVLIVATMITFRRRDLAV
ncbi:ABC transporter permease [Microlunatus parietis]|uniref:ABC-2 type transport system permease protein n=1 Tax=Microlunatus parietis TaxID=682979 RepID=A0A7Y9LAL1_9ACTN|nr:antibiotic ABC transporter [Microlunatus parietis]NYE69898.1 ABC-2 type transport system permease protein [Microlunatus parietis]